MFELRFSEVELFCSEWPHNPPWFEATWASNPSRTNAFCRRPRGRFHLKLWVVLVCLLRNDSLAGGRSEEQTVAFGPTLLILCLT